MGKPFVAEDQTCGARCACALCHSDGTGAYAATGSLLRHSTETPSRFEAIVEDGPISWVVCRVCHYEKQLGLPCGLPCV